LAIVDCRSQSPTDHLKLSRSIAQTTLKGRSAVQVIAAADAALKLEPRAGGVALWVGPGTEGYFSNLKITAK
jgi:hypothetical protein